MTGGVTYLGWGGYLPWGTPHPPAKGGTPLSKVGTPQCGQTPVKTVPSHCTTYVGCNNVLHFSFFLKIFGGHKFFSWGHWYLCFWTSGDICPGFQSQGGSLCMLSHLCDPQIHLWCDTCWLYRGQHGSRAFCRHVHKHWWRFGAWTHDRPYRTQQARRCKPLGHSSSAMFYILYLWIRPWQERRIT